MEVFHSAEDYLRRYGTTPCGCLIVDVRLPGMSGIDLHEALLLQGLRPAVVFVSGHADEDLRQRTLANGALDFLEKPFPWSWLTDKVREVMASLQ